MTDEAEIICVEHLTKSYSNREMPALYDVSFSVQRGEMVSVTGASGSGKSTLLRSIGALVAPTGGRIRFFGSSLWELSPRALAKFRRAYIGYVEQNFRLIDVLNVYENIILPLKLNGERVNKYELEELISRLRLDECVKRFPHELSGGEQQRVAVARAAAASPAVLIADEPTASLDQKNRAEVMKLLQELNLTTGQTVIFSTHDAELAAMANRTITLSDGRLVADRAVRRGKQ